MTQPTEWYQASDGRWYYGQNPQPYESPPLPDGSGGWSSPVPAQPAAPAAWTPPPPPLVAARRRHVWPWVAAGIVALVVGMALVVPTDDGDGRVDGRKSAAEPTGAPRGGSSGPAPEPTPEASLPPSVVPIGGSFTYDDGLRVTVVKLTRFRPSETNYGHTPGNLGVIAHITITNNTDQNFDTVLVQTEMTYGAAGEQAEKVFDTGQGIDGSFEGTIAPGRNRTARIAFSVPPAGASQIGVEVTPSFEHDPALFEGKV